MTTLDQAENFYRENVPILKWLNRRKTSSKSNLNKKGEENCAYEVDHNSNVKSTVL
ncbi:unnamed protein product [Clavelina lepadiformis]